VVTGAGGLYKPRVVNVLAAARAASGATRLVFPGGPLHRNAGWLYINPAAFAMPVREPTVLTAECLRAPASTIGLDLAKKSINETRTSNSGQSATTSSPPGVPSSSYNTVSVLSQTADDNWSHSAGSPYHCGAAELRALPRQSPTRLFWNDRQFNWASFVKQASPDAAPMAPMGAKHSAFMGSRPWNCRSFQNHRVGDCLGKGAECRLQPQFYMAYPAE